MNIDALQYLDVLRINILYLPGVEEYSCYGTPAFRVNKKLIARLREDGESIALRNEERVKWMQQNPEVYFITDHYLNYPILLVHLSKVKNKELRILLHVAWQSRATKKQMKEFENKNER